MTTIKETSGLTLEVAEIALGRTTIKDVVDSNASKIIRELIRWALDMHLKVDNKIKVFMMNPDVDTSYPTESIHRRSRSISAETLARHMSGAQTQLSMGIFNVRSCLDQLEMSSTSEITVSKTKMPHVEMEPSD